MLGLPGSQGRAIKVTRGFISPYQLEKQKKEEKGILVTEMQEKELSHTE